MYTISTDDSTTISKEELIEIYREVIKILKYKTVPKIRGVKRYHICTILICILMPQYNSKVITAKRYLLRNKPTYTHFTEFYNHPSFKGSDCWWSAVEREQRIKFMEALIKHIIENENDGIK